MYGIKIKDKYTDCILWPGYKDKDGYGQVKIDGKMRRAHRIALEIKLNRKLKSNEQAMHLCHAPACVNQDHLQVGSAKENRAQSRVRTKSLADQFLIGWNKLYDNKKD